MHSIGPPVILQPFRLCGLARGPAPTVDAFNRSACYLTASHGVHTHRLSCSICFDLSYFCRIAALKYNLSPWATAGPCPVFISSRLRREISQIYSNQSDGCHEQQIWMHTYSRSGCSGWHGGLPLQWLPSIGPHVILSQHLRTYAEFILFDLSRFE